MSNTKSVIIKVQSEGQNFACRGLVLDARTGERLAEGPTRPHGMRNAAYQDAERIAEERGWTVVEHEHA